MLLTFDDGHVSQFTNAARILRRHGFPATFFPMTVVLGQSHWMSPAQVRALDRMGMTIGAHTWDHHPVTGYRGKDWRVQLNQPARQLAGIVGHPIRWFAYPYGSWRPAALSHVAAAGYAAAWQLSDQPISARRPLLTLRRTLVNGSWTLPQFTRQLAAS